MSAARVLVTGASGFVGSRSLAPLVEQGLEVHAWRRGAAPAYGPEGVHWHACDLADAEAVRRSLQALRPTQVLHAAWYVEHGRFWDASENHDWVRWSTTFAQEAARVGVQRFVAVGTCAEYDWAVPTPAPGRGESDAILASTPYAACKSAYWQALQDLSVASGMQVAWGRLFHLYGPGEHPARLVPHLFAGLSAGREVALGPGSHQRDFMAVEDAGRALASLLSSPVAGAVNIASGEASTVAELAQRVGALVGRTDLLRLDALPSKSSDVAVMLADVTRLRDEVGFVPAVSLEEGLARYFAWWRDHVTPP